jgi:hypothetical protein
MSGLHTGHTQQTQWEKVVLLPQAAAPHVRFPRVRRRGSAGGLVGPTVHQDLWVQSRRASNPRPHEQLHHIHATEWCWHGTGKGGNPSHFPKAERGGGRGRNKKISFRFDVFQGMVAHNYFI